jgi:hypothetical protein
MRGNGRWGVSKPYGSFCGGHVERAEEIARQTPGRNADLNLLRAGIAKSSDLVLLLVGAFMRIATIRRGLAWAERPKAAGRRQARRCCRHSPGAFR